LKPKAFVLIMPLILIDHAHGYQDLDVLKELLAVRKAVVEVERVIEKAGSSLFCVGGLESWGLTRNSKDTTAMTGSISIAHHARLIARLCLKD